MGKQNIGTGFDGFLDDEGLLDEATVVAVKRVIAFYVSEAQSAARALVRHPRWTGGGIAGELTPLEALNVLAEWKAKWG